MLRPTVISALLVLFTVALACWLWLRPKPVVATTAGLEVGPGKPRLVPWSRVMDVREIPWMSFSPPWYPKMWQVDLAGGESFDFCGSNGGEWIEFLKRSDPRVHYDIYSALGVLVHGV